MPLAHWFRPPRRTLIVFVCLMLSLGAALGWLAWQVLERDRLLERSQRQDRLEQSADRVAAALQRQVEGLDRFVDADVDAHPATIPDHIVVMRVRRAGIESLPPGRLLFSPGVPPMPAASPSTFAEAERAEHQLSNPLAASRLYERLATTGSPEVRAAALVGLGRTLRKAGRSDAALDAYAALARMGTIDVAGRPAELAALEGRCTVLAEKGRPAELRQDAARLEQALWSGRWSLMRPVWEFQMQETRRWGAPGDPGGARRDALTLSLAAEWVTTEGAASARGTLVRRAAMIDGRPVLAVWKTSEDRIDAVVAGPRHVQTMWMQALATQRVRGAIVDGDRHVAAGAAIGDNPRAVRTAEITGLPWTLSIAAADPLADEALFTGRRRLLLAGFGVLTLVLLAGSFFILRSIQREAAVSRLQSEFVSAVSHEFRTPLTSLRQLSEMLSKGRVPTDDLKQESYDILARESERLQHLVESILDFGRMEAGSYRYRLEAIDHAVLVDEVAGECRSSAAAVGFTIDVSGTGTLVAVRADRAALALAMRNLLDNAVKYAAQSRTVRVEVTRHGDRAHVAVVDRGLGIPASEQRAIFQRFVRGAGARDSGIAGTGIGLTLAHQIVAAHGGALRLQSRVGEGSTFTMELPALERG